MKDNNQQPPQNQSSWDKVWDEMNELFSYDKEEVKRFDVMIRTVKSTYPHSRFYKSIFRQWNRGGLSKWQKQCITKAYCEIKQISIEDFEKEGG